MPKLAERNPLLVQLRQACQIWTPALCNRFLCGCLFFLHRPTIILQNSNLDKQRWTKIQFWNANSANKQMLRIISIYSGSSPICVIRVEILNDPCASLFNEMLPSPRTAKDFLVERHQGWRLEPNYQQTLSAPIDSLFPHFRMGRSNRNHNQRDKGDQRKERAEQSHRW